MKKVLAFIVMGLLLVTIACGKKVEKTVAKKKNDVKQEQVVEAFGTVKATRIENIAIDFPAIVQAVDIKEGQRVNAGDILFILDLSDYRSQIRTKEYDLETAKLELEKTENAVLDTKYDTGSEIDKLENNITQAKMELSRLQDELQRKERYLSNDSDPDIKKLTEDLKNAQELYAKATEELKTKEALRKAEAISQYELNEFSKTVDARQKAVTDAKLAIDSLKDTKKEAADRLQTSIEQKKAEIDNNKIQLARLKTKIFETKSIDIQREKVASLAQELERMKAKLVQRYIKSNNVVSHMRSAVVYEIGYQPGEVVTSTKKLYSLMDLDSVVIQANVSEEFIKDVKLGAKVKIIPQANGSKTYQGIVTKISDMAIKDNGETVIPVEVKVNKLDGFLLPNFNVDVEISIS